MKTPLLSICIATYNRAGFIGETLDSIIRQLTDEVEIVVVDGASTDATRTVMERYAADCPGLRYIRLPEKGGIDQDFCKAVEYARGEYCWLFPDDDLFKPGAVQRVLDELRNSYSLVIVNAEVMDRCLLDLAPAFHARHTGRTKPTGPMTWKGCSGGSSPPFHLSGASSSGARHGSSGNMTAISAPNSST